MVGLVAVGIHQFVVGILRHEVHLSHTFGRNDVHVPAELELDASRTSLSVELDAEVGVLELVLVLRVEKPAFSLALIVGLLALAQIALERILYLADLAIYVGRDDRLELTLVVSGRVVDFDHRLLDVYLLAEAELHDGDGAALAILADEVDVGRTASVHQGCVNHHVGCGRAYTVGRVEHEPGLVDAAHPVL